LVKQNFAIIPLPCLLLITLKIMDRRKRCARIRTTERGIESEWSCRVTAGNSVEFIRPLPSRRRLTRTVISAAKRHDALRCAKLC